MVAEYCNTTNPFAGGSNQDTITYSYKKPDARAPPNHLPIDNTLRHRHDGHPEMTPGHPYCPGNGSARWPQNQTVTVRELLAYMPFYFSLSTAALPANAEDGQLIGKGEKFAKFGAPMWPRLFDPNFFQAKWGLLTAERQSPCYNYSYGHHDCWNGPSWVSARLGVCVWLYVWLYVYVYVIFCVVCS